MRGPTFDDFRREVGTLYEAEVEGARVALTLAAAQELSSMGREGGAFRLEFTGPPQPVLPQATYPLHGAGQTHDIFIVPIGQDEDGVRYEAIFA